MLTPLQEYLTIYSMRLECEATRYIEIIPSVTSPFVVRSEEPFWYAGNDVHSEILATRAYKGVELHGVFKGWTFWSGWRLVVYGRIR